MLLTIDIGNTNIAFGIFKGHKLLKKFITPTKTYHFKKLHKLLVRFTIDDSLVCSVVPGINRVLEKDLRKILGKRPYIIGKDIKIPIRNLYRQPQEVGQDRLVNAYAGIKLYGAPLVVVDFGTAVTFDALSRNEEYMGGMIIPGLAISLDALAERAALLPKIKLNKPKEFIGRDTRSSILSGVVYGFAALVDALVMRISNKIGKRTSVIGTGGDIDIIRRYCKKIERIDRDLTLKGLNLVYQIKP